ncbi:VanZ family protein [Demequina litorisediminis]|nr:VanZ family protein [Demequina litorisediminis]
MTSRRGAPPMSSGRLDPGASIGQIGDIYGAGGLRALAGSFTFWQFAANIALFMPFGFFLHQASRWPGIAVVAVGASASMLIELSQGTGFFGVFPCPYRIFDVDDLIANTAGVVFGLVASYIAIGLLPFTRPPRLPDLAPPGRIRRAVAVMADLGIGLAAVTAIQGVGVVFEALSDGHTTPQPADLTPTLNTWVGAAVALVLGVVVPLVRADRATLGQAVMNIAPVRTAQHTTAPAPWAVGVRAVIRFVPWILSPTLLGPVAAMIELACTFLTRERQSVAGLASLTRTRSVPSIRADRARGDAPTVVMEPLT